MQHNDVLKTNETLASKMSSPVMMTDSDPHAGDFDYDALFRTATDAAAPAPPSDGSAPNAPPLPTAVIDTDLKVTLRTECLHAGMKYDPASGAPPPDTTQLREYAKTLLPRIPDPAPHYDIFIHLDNKLGPGFHVTFACIHPDLRTAKADYDTLMGNTAMWDSFRDQHLSHWRQATHPKPRKPQQFPAPTSCAVTLRIPTKRTTIEAATLAFEIEKYLFDTAVVDLTSGGLLVDAHHLLYAEHAQRLVVTARKPPKLPGGATLPFFELTIGIYCATLTNPIRSTLHAILACALPPPLVPYINSTSLRSLALSQLVTSAPEPSPMINDLTCFNTGCIDQRCACWARAGGILNDVPTLYSNPQQTTHSPPLDQTERLEGEGLLQETGLAFAISAHLGKHVSPNPLPSPFLTFFLADPSQLVALLPLIRRLAQDPNRHYIIRNIDLTRSSLQDELCLHCASPLHPFTQCHSKNPVTMPTGKGICPTMCTAGGCPTTGTRCTYKHPLGHYDPVSKTIRYSYDGPVGARTPRTDLPTEAPDHTPPTPPPGMQLPVPIPLKDPPSTHLFDSIRTTLSHASGKITTTEVHTSAPTRHPGQIYPPDAATSIAAATRTAGLKDLPPLPPPAQPCAARTLLTILSLDPLGSPATTISTITDAETASAASPQLQKQHLLSMIAKMTKTPASSNTLKVLHTLTGLQDPSHSPPEEWFDHDHPRPEAILATALARGFGIELITVTTNPDSSRILTQVHLIGDPATSPTCASCISAPARAEPPRPAWFPGRTCSSPRRRNCSIS